MKKLFFAPHPDDETLFGAYTILKEKPVVVVIKNDIPRMFEFMHAMEVLDAEWMIVDSVSFVQGLKPDVVYVPQLNNCHPLHNKVTQDVMKYFRESEIIEYATYTSPDDLQPKGRTKVEATDEMKALKLKALDCYVSQRKATPVHFDLVNKDEYYV
jgi:LmbE family N-acetylglucosaminyl deacetylase